jgi:hypothetical protein
MLESVSRVVTRRLSVSAYSSAIQSRAVTGCPNLGEMKVSSSQPSLEGEIIVRGSILGNTRLVQPLYLFDYFPRT